MIEDKGPLVLGVVIFTLVLGGIFVFARLFTRTVIRPHFGLDDALIVITWFLILGYNIAVFISVSRGYGRHVDDLSLSQYVSAVHAEVIAQVFAISSFPSGKASIAYLITRLFPGKKLRWFLWTFVAANAAFFYVDAIFIIAQCQPVAFQWDHSIKGTCWDPKIVINWGYLTGVTGAVTDFVFAILPWFYITKVKISLKEKISIGVALSAGFFASVCSVLKIYYTSTLGAHSDYTFDTVPLIIWSCVELALINIAACIPTLRPLYLWLNGKNPEGPMKSHSTYGLQSGTVSRRLARLKNRSARGAELGSADDVHELNIYRTKTCDITFTDRDDEQARAPGTGNSLSALVEARHQSC